MADKFLVKLRHGFNTLGKAFFGLQFAKFGYATGGTVTQATSKATAFTLDAVSGRIVFNGSALAAWTNSSATWTNSFIGSFDTVSWVQNSGTRGAYGFGFDCANGTCTVWIFNNSSTSLSEAVAIEFNLIHGSQT